MGNVPSDPRKTSWRTVITLEDDPRLMKNLDT